MSGPRLGALSSNRCTGGGQPVNLEPLLSLLPYLLLNHTVLPFLLNLNSLWRILRVCGRRILNIIVAFENAPNRPKKHAQVLWVRIVARLQHVLGLHHSQYLVYHLCSWLDQFFFFKFRLIAIKTQIVQPGEFGIYHFLSRITAPGTCITISSFFNSIELAMARSMPVLLAAAAKCLFRLRWA
jgi:hypothetical protein